MEATAAAASETLEQAQARHRRELKDLQGRITNKKKNATKKTRKGVNDECAEMERQTRERHAAELAALTAGVTDGAAEDDDDDNDDAAQGGLEAAAGKLSIGSPTTDDANDDTATTKPPQPPPSQQQQQQQQQAMSPERAGAFAALWLWNPMVATISTRGSSEGLLGVLTVALLWAVQRRRVSLAGALLGLGVHFKIYPFIYAPAIVWWMDDEHMGVVTRKPSSKAGAQSSVGATTLLRFCSAARIRLALVSLATFMGLNILMYSIYGSPFIVHTFLHHLTRIDHRHNFSPYNVLLYLTSANPPAAAAWHVESLAFVPQLLLSCVLIPFVLAKKDLATSMMAQTFAFVTFNKVCTSQVMKCSTRPLPCWPLLAQNLPGNP